MKPQLIVIGASLGGLRALQNVLSHLPKSFMVPVVVVQHRGLDSDEQWATMLAQACALPVREVEDKDPIQPGRVYLAPANYHLLIEGAVFALSVDDLVNWARPSIDVLFESAADAFGPGAIAVVLSGNSADGAHGAARIKEHGGVVIVQDPATAESPTMPEATREFADHVLKLEEIAEYLNANIQ